MKTICVLILLLATSCTHLGWPANPSGAVDQADCAHRCASLGMNEVYTGNTCGCQGKR